MLCGLFSFISLASASDFQGINNQLGLLKTDPMKTLTMIESRINSELITLSQDEREQLIQVLTELKGTLCSRPGAGLLMLPILVTIYFGFKSYYYYHEARVWSEYKAPSLFESLVISLLGAQQNALDECGKNLVGFIISLAVSIVTNIEYRENVAGLFAKERCIERKINNLIALVKQ
jgi:hypothetical protein